MPPPATRVLFTVARPVVDAGQEVNTVVMHQVVSVVMTADAMRPSCGLTVDLTEDERCALEALRGLNPLLQELQDWRQGLITDCRVLQPVTSGEVRRMSTLLSADFGCNNQFKDPKHSAASKLVLIERLFVAMIQAKIITIHQDDLLPDETTTNDMINFFRPERKFDVPDPVQFNKAFRALQSSGHESWTPVVKLDGAGTTAVTQMLDAVGIGPVKAAPWTVKNGNVRGPSETDPKGMSGRNRDGLYNRRYVYDKKRAEKPCNAKRVFADVPHYVPEVKRAKKKNKTT
jgi:hypothetical protein